MNNIKSKLCNALKEPQPNVAMGLQTLRGPSRAAPREGCGKLEGGGLQAGPLPDGRQVKGLSGLLDMTGLAMAGLELAGAGRADKHTGFSYR
jgi:hypothetical protein